METVHTSCKIFSLLLPVQVFDVSSVSPNYRELQEVSLFLAQSGTLDPSLALGLYISIGGAEWQYRGYVSNSQPSEVMPLQWPEQDQPLTVGPGTIQLGISLEPQGKSTDAHVAQLPYTIPTCSLPHLQHNERKQWCNAFIDSVSCSVVHLTPCSSYAAEIVQKEGTKLASRQDFAKRVALDLFRSQACDITACT